MRKRIATGLLLATGLFAWSGHARAGDTYRLDMPGPSDTPTLSLKADTNFGDTDTLAVRGYGGGGYRGGYGGYRGGYGGYRGGYGGYRGGYGGYRGGYGGYRGYGYGGYRGYGYGGYRGYGYGGYRGYGYGGYGYRGYGWGGYGYGLGYGGYGYGGYGYGGYPYYSTYSYPSYYYSTPCYPIGTTLSAPAYALNILPSSSSYSIQPSTVMPRADDGITPLPPSGAESYPYDGGPRAPVPMPPAEDSVPSGGPRIRPSPEVTGGRVVSLAIESAKTGKWQYPAYGELPRRSGR